MTSLFSQLFGRTQEANEAYTGIIHRNLADEPSLAVAVNNLISLKGSKDVNDSLRKLDRLREKDAQSVQLSRTVDLKLLRKQKEAMYTNWLLLLLHANKMNQVRNFRPEVSFSST